MGEHIEVEIAEHAVSTERCFLSGGNKKLQRQFLGYVRVG